MPLPFPLTTTVLLEFHTMRAHNSYALAMNLLQCMFSAGTTYVEPVKYTLFSVETYKILSQITYQGVTNAFHNYLYAPQRNVSHKCHALVQLATQ